MVDQWNEYYATNHIYAIEKKEFNGVISMVLCIRYRVVKKLTFPIKKSIGDISKKLDKNPENVGINVTSIHDDNKLDKFDELKQVSICERTDDECSSLLQYNSSETGQEQIFQEIETGINKYFTSFSVSTFFLGLGYFLPWNCIILHMVIFEKYFFFNLCWVEVATQLRTLCFVVGQLIMLFIGHRMKMIQTGIIFSVFHSINSISIGVFIVLLSPKAAFYIECFLVGLSGLIGSILHATIFALNSIVHYELAKDWTLGGGFSGPFSSLLSLILYFSFGRTLLDLELKVLLLFICASTWLIISALLLHFGSKNQNVICALRERELEINIWKLIKQGKFSLSHLHSEKNKIYFGNEILHITNINLDMNSQSTDDSLFSNLQNQINFVDVDVKSRNSCNIKNVNIEKIIISWFMTAASKRITMNECRLSLFTCYLLFLSTYFIYPVISMRLVSSSQMHREVFQLIIVFCFQIGNVLGRLLVYVNMLKLRRVHYLLYLVICRIIITYPIFFLHFAYPTILDSNLLLFACMFFFSFCHGTCAVLGALNVAKIFLMKFQKETSAYTMCLCESLAIACGVMISISFTFLVKNQQADILHSNSHKYESVVHMIS